MKPDRSKVRERREEKIVNRRNNYAGLQFLKNNGQKPKRKNHRRPR